ncbi:MAG: replicative DNA helicase [Myxococcales bacterium]|jgi:replicative DNA helicase|nr:replicative DNA helicase [Myxococcales bacterium]
MARSEFSPPVVPPPTSRVAPSSLEAERAVLGGMLLSSAAVDTAREILTRHDFYAEAHAIIFDAMSAIADRRQPIDQITLRAELVAKGKLAAVGGDDYLLALTDTIPAIEHIQAHATIVKEKATVRRLIAACQEIAARGYTDYGEFRDFLDHAESTIFSVAKEREINPYESLKSVVSRTFSLLRDASRENKKLVGAPTGFYKLDALTAGMHPGDLIIVAGRPGMGKTSFALNVGTNMCAATKKPVAVFSLEMPKDQLALRMLSSEARVDNMRVRKAELLKEDWPKLAKAAGALAELPIILDDTPSISVLELRSKARRIQAEQGLGLIIIDYLQLMRSGRKIESREQEISEISRSLKALAKELGLPIIALSQLNRKVEDRGAKDKRPQMSDLRESGAIEQDADTIWFVYRDEVYNKETADQGVAEIIVGKNRAGSTGDVRVRFIANYTRFENLEEREYDGMGGGDGRSEFSDE